MPLPAPVLSLRVPLVLASASPRRLALLRRVGLEPTVRPTDTDETWPGGPPGPAAEAIARRKAAAVHAPEALVVAADTVVVLGGDVLGKPATPEGARATLRRLSGQTHTVVTGFALVHGAREAAGHAETRVTFADLSDAEIAAYVATGAPMDKAGAYGIQDDAGALLVERIDGDFFNVVGLPVRAVYARLRADFADLLG